MSGPVDVLAVLGQVIAPDGEAYGVAWSDEAVRQQVREARAAVAELIEATEREYAAESAYVGALGATNRNDKWAAVEIARKRRRAALARVGGAN